jgi:hypothetical protein
MMKKILFAMSLILAVGAAVMAQNPISPPTPAPAGEFVQRVEPASIETILTEAEKQVLKYQEIFKNLIAVETKTTETYDGDGETEDRKIVESNFLVYQSAKDSKVTSELRNVLKVDGKPIPDSQAKSDQFFAELGKEKTLESELKKIEKESTKYDKGIEALGLTLNEGIVLSNNLRPYFDFSLQGTDTYQGSPVYVVSYQQTKKSPYITLNGGKTNSAESNLDFSFSLPGGLKNSDALLRGKLLIDAQTFQLRREERELTVQAGNPVVLLTNIFEYQPSEYEILVPKQISLVMNSIKKKDDSYTAAKDAKITFDYSKFRKSNVEVIILDDNQ